MPVAFVTQHLQQSYNVVRPTATISGAIPNNLLVLWCASRITGNGPATDNTGQWTEYAFDTYGGGYIQAFARVATGNANDNIDLSFSSNNNENVVAVNEYSGVQIPLITNGTVAFNSGSGTPSVGIGATFTPGAASATALFSVFQSANIGNFASETGFSIDSGFTIVGTPPRQSNGSWAGWKHGAHSAFGRSESTSPVTPTWTGDGSGTQERSTNVFSFLETSTGPPPGEDMLASISAAASAIATLFRVALMGASISAGAATAGTLETFPAGADMAASVAGSAAVSATLEDFPVQPGADMEAAVAGDASVLATLLVSGGLGGSLTAEATLDGTLSPALGFAAFIEAASTATGALSGVADLQAQVSGDAQATGTLTTAQGLAASIIARAFAILEAPSQFKPRFAMTLDLSPLFEETEFSFETIWNDTVTFTAILTDFYAESIGGGVNIAGTDPILIAEHDNIPQVREGDSIKIEDWEWVVREVMPSNTGIVRLKLEAV